MGNFTHAPIGPQTVSVQFPDPHFKKGQKKRRVVTPDFVRVLGDKLTSDKVGDEHVWLQSDVKDVLDDMRDAFREDERFIEMGEGGYWDNNWTGVPTEREISVFNKEEGGEVWRSLFKIK